MDSDLKETLKEVVKGELGSDKVVIKNNKLFIDCPRSQMPKHVTLREIKTAMSTYTVDSEN